jgi:Glycosyl transferase family 2
MTQPQVAGLRSVAMHQAADAKHAWVLCLDDDVALPPSALQMLVDRMQAQPSTFMATGSCPFLMVLLGYCNRISFRCLLLGTTIGSSVGATLGF